MLNYSLRIQIVNLLKNSILFFVVFASLSFKPYIKVKNKLSVQKNNLILDTIKITTVPISLGFDKFYQKYTNVKGIPIVSSEKVDDKALIRAGEIINLMLAKIPIITKALTQNKAHVIIVAGNELMTDIPEYKDLDIRSPGVNWNERVRGLGGTLNNPICSCGEENLLCQNSDKYSGQNILVHEFAHTIHQVGINFIDKNFDNKLIGIYNLAIKQNLWTNTYAISNPIEYFAVGVQCWFNVNKRSIPSNGISNEIGNRDELKLYDPALYNLLTEYFEETDALIGCGN